MRRVLGFVSLIALATGLAVGTAGTVAGQQGQTGYDDTVVLGEEEALPEGAELHTIDLTSDGGDSFGDTIEPGSFLDVVADGFGPETKGTIDLTSERLTLAFVTADEEGVIRHRVEIPEDVELGDHVLHIVGVDPDGNPREVSVGIEIGFGDGGSNWPAWTAGSIALALAAVGYIYWRQGARRRTEDLLDRTS